MASTFEVNNLQPVVPAIDLTGNKVSNNEATPVALAVKYGLVGEVAVTDIDGSSIDAIKAILKVARCRVRSPVVDTVDGAVDVLNAGAAKVVVAASSATREVLGQLPRDRVVVAVDVSKGDAGWATGDGEAVAAVLARVAPLAAGLLVTFVGGVDMEAAKKLAEAVQGQAPAVQLTVAGGISSGADIKQLDSMGIESQVCTALANGALSLGAAFCAAMTTDRPDGLVATIVANEQKQALGLCYSSAASVAEALEKQRGVYQSRKRGLVMKGATSGDIQELVKVELDCDRDALRFTVRQLGKGYCHRRDATCFGPHEGLAALMATLQSRKASAPEGSYTKRLFDDPALLKAKLLEEATELGEATSKDEIAWEAADVIYFALAAAVKADVSLADIEKHLDTRALKVTRRKGDAKPQFVQQVAATSAPTPAAAPAAAAPQKEAGPVVFPRLTLETAPKLCPGAVDPKAREIAESILNDVRARGEAALVEHAIRLGDLQPGQPYVRTKEEMKAAFDALPAEEQGVLTRTAERIRVFAQAQRDSITDMTRPIAGGEAGHRVQAVDVAGCYAPGGRYPLPSSVLMTAITARVAGCKSVWVASPRPHPIVLAAGHVAGADSLLAVGGAQAIAAFAVGAGEVPQCHAVVGPGNRFVTAAKSLVAGSVAMDSLAGPSECLVVADDTCDPSVVAADLLAQAEHDPNAVPILVALSEETAAAVEQQVNEQLKTLETADIARKACDNGFVLVAKDIEEAIVASNQVAPEHLEVHTRDADAVSRRMENYGGLFVGHQAAEVLGDYGAGPNHTLPTGGTARSFGGLSVVSFLRMRTWMRIDDTAAAQDLVSDCVALAELEGLKGHAAAARKRLQ